MTSSSFIHVRPSESRDNAAIDLLLREAHDEQQKYRGQLTPVSSSDIAFVAEVGDSIVGVLQIRHESSHAAFITCVHVHAAAREIGIGDTLMLHTLQYLQSNGVTWVGGQAQPGDRSLKNLFERHGLVAQSIVVGKSLSDPSTAEHASQ